MSVLSWDKPERAMPVEVWQNIVADSAPPGVYIPNMSGADKRKWKAKIFIKTDNPRVEVRKTLRGTQVVLIIWQDEFKMSANGPMFWDRNDFADLNTAITEARDALSKALINFGVK